MQTGSRPALFLTDAGAGEPVLLLTGWTISSAVFDPVARLYVPHMRVIAYDHRGTGRSAPWHGPVSMAMLAADAARVLDERDLDAAHIVGVSMGALVALELAARMPWRVRSLVLVGGAAGGPLTALPHPFETVRSAASVARDSLRHGGLWPEALLFSRRFSERQPERVAELTEPFTRHRPPPWVSGFQLVATSCFARRRSLPRIAAPTLIVHGSDDAMSPVANAQAMAHAIPGARLHVVRGAGHAAPLEAATECAALLRDWVTEHRDRPAARPSRAGRVAERATRPFALAAGAARNTRDLPAWWWRQLSG